MNKIFGFGEISIFCDLFKFQKSRQNGAVFGSVPSKTGHGSSHAT